MSGACGFHGEIDGVVEADGSPQTPRIFDLSVGEVATGSDDRVMKLQIAEAASARFGWPLHVIDNCGHGLFWDRPDEFADTLREALRS